MIVQVKEPTPNAPAPAQPGPTAAAPDAAADAGLDGAAARGTARRVFVTVGSDHHRFDRLVRWVDAWAADRGLGPDDVLVQHGTADPPRTASGVDFLSHDELLRLMAAAGVVVAQGGPMSMIEARGQGHRPVVLPRSAALDEVVDDHQLAFCRRVEQEGWIHLVSDEAGLRRALDAAIADPRLVAAPPDPAREAHIRASIGRFARIADRVMSAPAPAARPTVLMLGGFGRSGSTLLERTLGETPGVVAIGEVVHLWARGLVEDQRCGCGETFSRCPFWTAVGDQAFGGWAELDAEGARADLAAVVRNRHLGALLTGLASPRWRLCRQRLTRRTSALYAAAAGVGNGMLLVDSSKHPAYAVALRQAHVDLRCVLVVRDPRGVAYSWSKTVARPEITGTHVEMPRYGAAVAAVQWSFYSVAFEAIRLLRVPVMVVRYEDFVNDPRTTMGAVLRFAGRDDLADHLGHVSDHEVDLGVHHTVAGNPMRFQVGAVLLRVDEEWRRRMPGAQRRLVSALTTPLRRYYGYRDRA